MSVDEDESQYPGLSGSRLRHWEEGMATEIGVTIDRDEDGVWVVECPAIPGCVSQGKTKEEGLANIEDAIRLCLEVRAERGLPLTADSRPV